MEGGRKERRKKRKEGLVETDTIIQWKKNFYIIQLLIPLQNQSLI